MSNIGIHPAVGCSAYKLGGELLWNGIIEMDLVYWRESIDMIAWHISYISRSMIIPRVIIDFIYKM